MLSDSISTHDLPCTQWLEDFYHMTRGVYQAEIESTRLQLGLDGMQLDIFDDPHNITKIVIVAPYEAKGVLECLNTKDQALNI